MNSQALLNWIQIVTGISVLIGLALVVWELQLNRDATYSQLSSEYYHIAAQDRAAIYGEGAAEVLAKACHRPNELSESDLIILDEIYNGLMQRVMRMRMLRQRGGFYGADTWREGLPLLDGIFSTQIGRAYWKSVAPNLVHEELVLAGNEYLEQWHQPMCDEQHSAWLQTFDELNSQ